MLLCLCSLQLMWERTVQCLMVYLSSASSQEEAPLVSCSLPDCAVLGRYHDIITPIICSVQSTQAVNSLCSSRCGEVEQTADGHRHQLGRRPASRKEVRGFWVLLRQRHRPRYSGVTEVSTNAISSTALFLHELLIKMLVLETDYDFRGRVVLSMDVCSQSVKDVILTT